MVDAARGVLRHIHAAAGHHDRDGDEVADGVGGHEPAQGGGVVASLGVVEVGFGVALIAGEFVRGHGR